MLDAVGMTNLAHWNLWETERPIPLQYAQRCGGFLVLVVRRSP